ncbi:hypothetical protein O9G_001753 [Rozella allomycis CSF55]|uniref:Uncharacterized protein n=1 Tax=Rozella allomycis (strain CSF55) TaxID=988480 RepID=A0A075ASS9_ROZAC|nr:hypothetical protein O9G_001753 [Rozella allomycis CSF55]|eukprot:EPZ33341.1 hypothetical protein O9G_001753 [Rozella allomycis CSF55]
MLQLFSTAVQLIPQSRYKEDENYLTLLLNYAILLAYENRDYSDVFDQLKSINHKAYDENEFVLRTRLKLLQMTDETYKAEDILRESHLNSNLISDLREKIEAGESVNLGFNLIYNPFREQDAGDDVDTSDEKENEYEENKYINSKPESTGKVRKSGLCNFDFDC